MTTPERPRSGQGVDSDGRAVIDPTANVLQLVEAAIRRQDDLRSAAEKMAELRAAHAAEVTEIRAQHTREMRNAEAERINAIREVDVSAVARAAEVSAQAAQTLAAQVATVAEAMRVQVATTAAATATSQATALEPLQRAVDELRQEQYKQAGQKIQVVEQRATSGEGRSNIGVIVGVAGALLALAGVMCGGLTIAVSIVVALTR